MAMSDENRLDFFNKARALHPSLGDLFQNPMELTAHDLSAELDAIDRAEADALRRFKSYRSLITGAWRQIGTQETQP